MRIRSSSILHPSRQPVWILGDGRTEVRCRFPLQQLQKLDVVKILPYIHDPHGRKTGWKTVGTAEAVVMGGKYHWRTTAGQRCGMPGIFRPGWRRRQGNEQDHHRSV
jgi:hypothetical protein